MTNCSYYLIGPSPNRLFQNMRSSKTRPRSKNNRNNHNRSGANIMNRVFDSSGPEGKVRGTPQQIIEKYQLLTRDAQLSGDRVAAENFQQHAEHYMRLLADAQREIEARRDQQDRENREKQAQRDQERGERSDRAEPRRNSGDDEHAKMPSALDVADFSDAPQPDLAPLNPADLAQTPPREPSNSAEPAKPRVRRRPAKPVSDPAPEADAAATPAPVLED
ncbi:DUF4167 domain-containing protein [uncultured Planktomarina sp.]|jgi:hypothetical protein|uniref:DUF4167 domain-containing protein n=1 Tax=uncultured Planktomarina sp. TaxID=1538529 RepID=UPI0032603E9C